MTVADGTPAGFSQWEKGTGSWKWKLVCFLFAFFSGIVGEQRHSRSCGTLRTLLHSASHSFTRLHSASHAFTCLHTLSYAFTRLHSASHTFTLLLSMFMAMC